jgi:hypothetical protein
MNKKTVVILPLLILFMVTGAPALASDEESLAKQSQNPVGDIISLPFEYNVDFGVGPEETEVHSLTLKPVYPVNLGEFNLINRFILPVVHQGERVKGEGSESGLGDFTYQGFISPAKPSKVIWGLGPVITIPTHTDNRFGTDRWSGGPAALALTAPGHWLFGALAQHFWSFAGNSNDDKVNLSSLQYFINYNMDDGWYLTSGPTMTANWEADSSDRFKIPLGGGVGRLVRFGKLPVDFKAQGFWNVEKPEGAADWTMQLQVKFLFPK